MDYGERLTAEKEWSSVSWNNGGSVKAVVGPLSGRTTGPLHWLSQCNVRLYRRGVHASSVRNSAVHRFTTAPLSPVPSRSPCA